MGSIRIGRSFVRLWTPGYILATRYFTAVKQIEAKKCLHVCYLDLEALDVVIAHPLVSLVSIWHILGLVPNLSCSIFQKVTDL